MIPTNIEDIDTLIHTAVGEADTGFQPTINNVRPLLLLVITNCAHRTNVRVNVDLELLAVKYEHDYIDAFGSRTERRVILRRFLTEVMEMVETLPQIEKEVDENEFDIYDHMWDCLDDDLDDDWED